MPVVVTENIYNVRLLQSQHICHVLTIFAKIFIMCKIMALIRRNGQALIGDSERVLSFTGGTAPNEDVAVTIGIYEIIGGVIQLSNPSRVICPGVMYALRVFYPLGIPVGGVFFMTSGTSGNTFTATEVTSANNPPANLVTFSSDVIDITMNTTFSGYLTVGSNRFSGNFVLLPSTRASAVGYNMPLPTILSNCNICNQCGADFCQSDGLCNNIVPPCIGICEGQCFGDCPAGLECVSVNGSFTCQSGVNAIAYILLTVLAVIFILALIALFYWGYSSTPTDVSPSIAVTQTPTVTQSPTVTQGTFAQVPAVPVNYPPLIYSREPVVTPTSQETVFTGEKVLTGKSGVIYP